MWSNLGKNGRKLSIKKRGGKEIYIAPPSPSIVPGPKKKEGVLLGETENVKPVQRKRGPMPKGGGKAPLFILTKIIPFGLQERKTLQTVTKPLTPRKGKTARSAKKRRGESLFSYQAPPDCRPRGEKRRRLLHGLPKEKKPSREKKPGKIVLPQGKGSVYLPGQKKRTPRTCRRRREKEELTTRRTCLKKRGKAPCAVQNRFHDRRTKKGVKRLHKGKKKRPREGKKLAPKKPDFSLLPGKKIGTSISTRRGGT